MNSSTRNAPWRWKNSTNGRHIAATVAGDPPFAGRLAVPRGLAHDQRGQHRRQRERRAGQVGGFPADARRDDQRQRAGAGRADPPAILRHARADAELARLEQLDPVGVDDDVEGGAGDADQDRGGDDRADARRRVDEREVDDRGDHQRPGDQHPRHALAEPAEHRQPHAVDDPGPEEFEIVGEEGEREGGDVVLSMPSCFSRVVSVAPIIA